MRFFATLLEGSCCSVSMIWLQHQPTATNRFQVEIWIKQCSPTPTINHGQNSMAWSTSCLDKYLAQTVVLQPDCIYIHHMYVCITTYEYVYINIYPYKQIYLYIYVKHIIFMYIYIHIRYIGWIRMIPPFIIHRRIRSMIQPRSQKAGTAGSRKVWEPW